MIIHEDRSDRLSLIHPWIFWPLCVCCVCEAKMNSFEKRHATLELQQAAHVRHVVSTKTNATCVDWHGLAVVVEMTHLPFQLNHCDSLFVCLKQPTERWRVVSTYLHLRFAFSIGWSWIFVAVVTLSCIWDTNCIPFVFFAIVEDTRAKFKLRLAHWPAREGMPFGTPNCTPSLHNTPRLRRDKNSGWFCLERIHDLIIISSH
jgi:hypothetical protein